MNISTTEMGIQTKTNIKKRGNWNFTLTGLFWIDSPSTRFIDVTFIVFLGLSERSTADGSVLYFRFRRNGEGKKRDVFYREGILLQIGCRVRKHRDKWQTEHVSTCMKLGHPDWFYISLNREHFTSGMLGPVTPGSRGLRKVSIENDRLGWALGPRVRWWFHSKGWND